MLQMVIPFKTEYMNLGSKNVEETSSMQDYMAMNGVTGGVSIKFFCLDSLLSQVFL